MPAKTTLPTWTIDPTHTTVGFAVRHLMISTVKGRFTGLSGTARLDPADLAASSIEVAIDTATVDTGVPQRDDHLRSADFFDAANHPEMTYRSRKVEARSDTEFQVLGDLTIRGVTREVPLALEYLGRTTDPWGGDRVGFSATAKINRHDFGLDWNTALEAGGVLVGAEVKISLGVELVRQAVQAAAA